MRFLCAVTCLWSAFTGQQAHAWGSDGHAIIASVAARMLSKNARTRVAALLGQEGNTAALPKAGGDDVEALMANASSWADVIVHDRDTWGWSQGLHFLNVQDDACWIYGSAEGPHGCTYDHDRDCKDDFCVIGAIKNYSMQLKQQMKSDLVSESLVSALKFVIHFLGDIHQPLHCGLNKDRGGVLINVIFPVDKQADSLHKVWDFGMINYKEGEQGHYANMVNSLQGLIQGSLATNATTWEGVTDPTAWAEESLAAATRFAYRYPNGTAIAWHPNDKEHFTLPFADYSKTFMPPGGVVDQQLAKAAVRLAAKLNDIFADEVNVVV